MHSIYFLSYAIIATISLGVIFWAQWERKIAEGTPINRNLLLLVGAVALAMWLGAAFTEFAYNINTYTAASAAFASGVVLSAVFAWQINRVLKHIASDAHTIKQLATKDALTSLWNLRVFHEKLSEEVTRARRFKNPLALVMLDIDAFEAVNDKHGYTAGDMILVELGARLLSLTRSIDYVCRLGAEEFAMILPGTVISDAQPFFERIRAAIEDTPFDIGDGNQASITISIGVVSFGEGLDAEDSLIHAAKDRLESAKNMTGSLKMVS